MNEIRAFATKLRKAAEMLDELMGDFKHNETPKTAHKILKKSKSLKKDGTPRKNPWNNPVYRKNVLAKIAKAKAAKKKA